MVGRRRVRPSRRVTLTWLVTAVVAVVLVAGVTFALSLNPRDPGRLAAGPPPGAAPPALPTVTLPPEAPLVALPPPAGRTLTIQLTGYSFLDNTPPGSSIVCCSVLHRMAGGQGTVEDPITVAVPGSEGAMAFRAGTRFYLPTVRRYVIVEDSGASVYPLPHLDMWVDGRGSGAGATEACMDAITGRVPAELNPPPGRPVRPGPIDSGHGCNIP